MSSPTVTEKTIDLGNKRFVVANGEVVVRVELRGGKWKESAEPARVTAKRIATAGYHSYDRTTGEDRSAWYGGRSRRRVVRYRIGNGEWQIIPEENE